MLVYVQTLLNIALRKLGPEDLPDSGFLVGLTLVGYVLMQVPLAWIAYGPSNAILSTIIVSALLLVAFIWVLLRVAGFRQRYRQTLTALLGTSALLSLMSLPFSVWREATVDLQAASALPSIFIFAIMLWSLAIDGHILSRALSRPFAIGLMLSISYFFVHTTILFELLPDTVTVPSD
ncbi:MAG: hypothetical protein ACR2QV_09535 [Gammaproteobacteria bacterium]